MWFSIGGGNSYPILKADFRILPNTPIWKKPNIKNICNNELELINLSLVDLESLLS